MGAIEFARKVAEVDDASTVVATEWDSSLNGKFSNMLVETGNGPLSMDERNYAAAHVELWRELVSSGDDRPMLILEDNVVVAHKFGVMVAHYVWAVEKAVQVEERCLVIFLSG